MAVVVPARDEAAVLPGTLPALLAQDYPGPARVVLVDDLSSDGTAACARSLAETAPAPKLALTVVTGKPRPPGWAGKPWAMAQGVAAAMSAEPGPEWLLFTDADIAHPPTCLRRLVQAARDDRRQAVSLMARLNTGTGWERLLMPAFVYFFAQIYPFGWVNDRGRTTAAAAGGCLLVEARSLEEAGGIDAIAAATIDDIALAKAIKGAGFDIWLGLAGPDEGADGGGDGRGHDGNSGDRVGDHGNGNGDDAPGVRSRRAYPNLGGIWEMVARNAYTQLHYNPAAVAGTVAGLAALYLSPPLMAAAGVATRRPALAGAGLAAWTAMTATYLPIVRYYRASPAGALALPFTASLYAAMTVSSALRHHRRRPAGKGPSTS